MSDVPKTEGTAQEDSEELNNENSVSQFKSPVDESDQMKLNVFIVDDSKEIRNRLKEMLKENKSISLIGETEDAGQAVVALQHLHPDVVIFDIHMPQGGGMRVLKDIKMRETDTIAMVFTAFPYAQYRRAYLAAGADYFFDKTQDVQNMLDTLDTIAQQHIKGRKNEEKPVKHN